MDLTQRRTFALGATIASIAGLSIGVVATREPGRTPTAPPTARPIARRTIEPQRLPVATEQPPREAAQHCLLAGTSESAIAASAARQSGAIHLSVDQRTAAVAEADNNEVVLLALDGARATVSHRFETQRRPTHVLMGADARVFVTERESSTVSIYDGRTGARLCQTRVAHDPYAMALSADGRTLLVTSGSSAKLTALDTRTMQTKWTTDTQREPRAVAFSRDGSRAMLSHIAGKPLSIIDVSGERPRALEVADAPVPVESQRIGGGGGIETASFRNFGGDFRGGRGGLEAPPQPTVTATVRPVPSQAWSLAAMVERDEVIVPFMVNRTGRELPPILRVDRYGGGSVSEQRQNEKVTFSFGVFDLQTMQWKRFEMPNGVRRFVRGSRESARAFNGQHAVRIPMASAIDPRTGSLVVASLGTSEIASIPLARTTEPAATPTARRSVSSHAFVEQRPFDGPVRTLSLSNVSTAQHEETLAQPSGVAVTSDGVVLVYSQFDHAVELRKDAIRTRIQVGNERLPEDIARGRRLFYTANNAGLTSGGLSCGGCHPDGRDDGLVWFLANGPRQTPTLAGRLVAPFNWTGTHRTIEGNVAQTITRLGGTGMPISDIDAIAAYVSRGIDAPAPEPPSEPPAADLVARGRDVFMNAGNCASCHDPARNFTDGQTHELGGLGSDERERTFDTPSLRMLRATGPFFHDGRYQTLRELLTDARARMGTIGSLSLPDVEALEAFLLTL